MSKYYADLNPLFPSNGAKKWAVFFRGNDKNSAVRVSGFEFMTRKAAEGHAARMSEKCAIMEATRAAHHNAEDAA